VGRSAHFCSALPLPSPAMQRRRAAGAQRGAALPAIDWRSGQIVKLGLLLACISCLRHAFLVQVGPRVRLTGVTKCATNSQPLEGSNLQSILQLAFGFVSMLLKATLRQCCIHKPQQAQLKVGSRCRIDGFSVQTSDTQKTSVCMTKTLGSWQVKSSL
jgi:hypothetical protein